ncbi:glutamate--cysteine ligase [Streptomyces bambusae]|uniref:carboxylate-amine ligase n=1 Tax=Streptomyces bambusae TaxID=1550616 RepID=UPI001CFF7901|nr:glutamate--cysteine ligase [Streptomyces bambusae]MCB5169498.1 glutamate--cysteine ligase [Streptomyces bambusae]
MSVLTMGVEEEFVLVDRDTRRPVDRAPEVIATAAGELGPRVQTEFFNAQVEACTEPAADLGRLRDDLVRLRRTVGAAAAEHGCRLVATGTPVLPPARPLTVTDSERYRRMARQFAALVGRFDGLVCGCHVHVGTLDRSEALALANHMRPWLPVLQSLAGNSPFSGGRDTGFESWRFMEFSRWPTVGPAPVLEEPQYEAYVGALVAQRVLMDRRMVYWFARPSEHCPTLEIRVADVNAELDTVVLLAALVRGLAASLLAADVAEGRPPPDVPDRRLRAAHGLAAAQGRAGTGLDPVTGAARPAEDLVDALVARAAPGLEAAGDRERVAQLLGRLRTRGSGAARQRAVLRRRGRLTDVVDALALTTTAA